MPWKRVRKTLKEMEERSDLYLLSTEVLFYGLNRGEVKDVSIESKKVKISANMKGWGPFRNFGAGFTTKLGEEELESFYQNVPDFLRKAEYGNLNILISRPLMHKKEKMTYVINFVPGYVVHNKNVLWEPTSKNLVATALYPEAYPGKELDGFWVREKIDEDLFTKYMRLKGEAERLGFVTSVIRPKKGECKAFVCIEPWEMEKEEFVDFTKNLMKKKETKNLTIMDRKFAGNELAYEYKANLYPSKDVEVAIVGKRYNDLIRRLFERSLDLFSVEFKGNEKVTYEAFYETESKLMETLSEIGSRFSEAVKAPFIALGGGLRKVGDAVSEKWDDYKARKERKTKEIIEELRSSKIPLNIERKGSCYVAYDKACLIKQIKRKKTKKS